MDGFETKFIELLLMIGGSLVLRWILVATGQVWVKTVAHTATLLSLPVITYVITSVISGNIALSLGMVGALSIVRFRNPVRSPLELAAYFASITIGISASVQIKWLVFLISSLLLVACILSIWSAIFKIVMKRSFFTSSFAEGNSQDTLEITSEQPVTLPLIGVEMILNTFDGSEYNYVYSSASQQNLIDYLEVIQKEQPVLSYKLSK